MRALFIGGAVDNSEFDLDGTQPPIHYPENTGGGQSRYNLHHVGRRDGAIAYAVYAAPEDARGNATRRQRCRPACDAWCSRTCVQANLRDSE